MLTRSALFVLSLGCACLAACGAKSALEIASPTAPRADAGLADARPGIDAAASSPCALRASEPLSVHEDDRGSFDQPQVAVRADGTIDLVTRRVGDAPDRSEVRARRARVDEDGTVAFLGEPVRLFGPSIWNRVGALGAELGTCSTAGGPTDLTELRSWDTSYGETRRAMPLAALACHDVVGRGDRWLLVTRGIADGTVVLERRADGAMVRGPAFAFEPAVGANASAAAIDDGFAWVGVLDAMGRTQIVLRDDEGNDAREELRIAPRTGAAKPVVGPGFGAGTAAVAYYEADELFVSIVERGRGVTRTSIPLAFSMDPDVDPAVLRLEGHVLAISLDYGDADPTGGALNVASLASDLAVTDRLAIRTRRDASLRYGGVSAALVGRTAVVHWVEGREDGTARTLVTTLACR